MAAAVQAILQAILLKELVFCLRGATGQIGYHTSHGEDDHLACNYVVEAV